MMIEMSFVIIFVVLCIKDFAVEKDESKVEEKEERIVKDLKQMSQKERMKLLKNESPELLELIQDFKAKVRHEQGKNIFRLNERLHFKTCS